IDFAGDPRLFVIIIGHCVPTRTELSSEPADFLLHCLQQGEKPFYDALHEYAGRHAVIFGSKGNIKIVNDATAMRSVFYAANGGVVASHALLVEQALGGRIDVDDLPFKYGYPGNWTPYTRTKLLTANTFYWFTAHVIGRF